jgi:hypothetical protein
MKLTKGRFLLPLLVAMTLVATSFAVQSASKPESFTVDSDPKREITAAMEHWVAAVAGKRVEGLADLVDSDSEAYYLHLRDLALAADVEDLTAKFNVFNLFDPIDKQGIVPDQWKVPQPMSGLSIYEPVAFMQGVKNQLEMDIAHAEWALPNLCLQAGCEIEEAAARLGYAAWNLDKAVQRQLAEAIERGEIDGQAAEQLSDLATVAAGQCRGARELLLAQQPSLPNEMTLASVQRETTACIGSLRQSLQAL